MPAKKVIKLGAFTAVALSILVGCATVYNFPLDAYTNYPENRIRKIDLAVAVLITDELKSAKIHTNLVGGSETILFGKNLEDNSVALAKAIFNSAVITNDKNIVQQPAVDALLVPELVGQSRDLQKHQTISADLKWKLIGRTNQLIYVDTVSGSGSADVKVSLNPFSEYEERARTETIALLSDLFDKSFVSIYHSPEIRNYASAVHKNR